MDTYADYFQNLLREYDDNFNSIELKQINNKSDYDSIVISSDMTAYRPKVDNVLFARIKTTGQKPFISFRKKYADWFIQNGIPTYTTKSDTEFIRISLDDFQFALDFGNHKFVELAVKICVDAMNFAPFGCCDRFVKCSDAKKCVHRDLLYSTACMYRKNLEAGKIFYGKNKNVISGGNMEIKISFDGNEPKVEVLEAVKNNKTIREFKGKSLFEFPKDFTIIDLETTGLDPTYCEIIEVAAIKVRNFEIIDTYSSLVHIDEELDEFITELTGITNEMLSNAPNIDIVLNEFINFVGTDIIIGHNVNFDINFVYDNLLKHFDKPFSNDFVDTLRICRKLYPHLKHHRLKDMIKELNIISNVSHRSLADCESCLEIYLSCKNEAEKNYSSIENFITEYKKNKRKYIDIKEIVKTTDNIDDTHPLYNRECVFTGALDKMKRADAMQLVVNCGGSVNNSVTKNTNYLILGNLDFCKSIRDGKSAKHKKAELLKLKDQDIEIISEQTFYDMLEI